MSSKAQKLATLSSDVNELADLADQVTEIENAISRANTNAQEIDSISDSLEELSAINSIYNSGISYSSDNENEYYDASTPSGNLAKTEFVEMNLINPQEGDLMSFNAAANNWINSTAPVIPEPVLSFRNKIINGDMRIDQRNAGATLTSAGANSWVVDRWICYHNIATVDVGQYLNSITPPAGFSKYLGIEVTSTATASNSEFCNFQHYVEGFNMADLAWGTANAKTITISFWIRSSLTGTQGFAIQNAGSDTGYPFTVTINNADTWEYKTVQIAGPTTGTWNSTNGRGITFIVDLGMGTNFRFTAGSWQSGNVQGVTGANSLTQTLNATFYITGVQLEEGTVATPFEHRPHGLEQSLCQRYYCEVEGTYYGNNWSGYSSSAQIHFPVTMRVSPTCSLISIQQSNSRYVTGSSGFWQGGYGSKNKVIFWTMAQADGGNDGYFAQCTFDAEL